MRSEIRQLGRLAGLLGLVALLAAAAGFAGPAAAASSVRLGVGAFGVYGLPVVQEDAGAGPLYGAKLRADLTGPLGVEAAYTSFQEGDVTFPVQGRTQTIAGGTQNAITLNAVVGGPSIPGFGVYITGGVGTYTLTKDNREDLTPIGFNGGLGIEMRTLSGVSLDLSARLHAVMPEDGGTRKFAAFLAGVNFYFLR